MPLLEIDNLSVDFPTTSGRLKAVDRVSLALEQGEVLGIVGESGSGKSVTMLAMMGLVAYPGEVRAERLSFAGQSLLNLSDRERRRIAGKDVAMVFQEPTSSLNPCFTIGFQLGETLRVHEGLDRAARRRRSIVLLEQVGIPAPESGLNAFPHQLSGGMNQRVMIAMAIACNPRLLIADEPTTALDVTIQAQILDLLLSPGEAWQARDRAQQSARIGMQRFGKQRRHRGLFHLAAGVHHDHALGGFRHHAEVVGDEHHRRAELLLQPADQRQDLRLDGDVERRGRFVGDQDLWIAGECHRDHGALAHAAGELVGVFLDPLFRLGNAHQLQHFGGPPHGRGAGQALVQDQRLADLAADGHDRVERGHRLLENHGNLVAADGAHRRLIEPDQVDAVETCRAADDAAGRIRHQPQDRERRHALAATRLADDRQGLAAGERERHAVHGLHQPVAGVEVGAQIDDFEHVVLGCSRRCGDVGGGMQAAFARCADVDRGCRAERRPGGWCRTR